MPKFDNHAIGYVEDVTQEWEASVSEDGNISLVALQTLLDTHETSLWCNDCGIQIGTSQEYLDHGISENWEVL